MSENTVPVRKPKVLQNSDDVCNSLIALRDEMNKKYDEGIREIPLLEVIAKMNSCLFSKYPVTR